MCCRIIESMDGLIMASPASYEPGSTAVMKNWFAETGRPAYSCGPLLPPSSKAAAAANEIKQSPQGMEIQAFLDDTLKVSGEKSLLYVWNSGITYEEIG